MITMCRADADTEVALYTYVSCALLKLVALQVIRFSTTRFLIFHVTEWLANVRDKVGRSAVACLVNPFHFDFAPVSKFSRGSFSNDFGDSRIPVCPR